mgnify:FL=1
MNKTKGIMGLQDGGVFTGPDTSTPFEKNVSEGDVAREEYENLPTEIQTIKGAEDLPSVAVPVEDGVIKSMGTGIVESGKVPIVPPAPKDYLTQAVPTEPVELLPKGMTISRVTGKVKGIEVPGEYAAVAGIATAYAGYTLLKGSSKLATTLGLKPPLQGLGGPLGPGATSVYGTGAGATAAQVVGGAAAVLSLYDMYKNGVSIENGLALAGGTAMVISGAAAKGAAWASGSFASSHALAVAGPVMLSVAALAMIYDALKKPSNKTGIAHSNLSAEEYTITQDGLTGDKYSQNNRDGSSALLAPILDYVRVMEDEYEQQLGGHVSIQLGNERGLEVIVASEDGRIFIEKDFGRSETAVDEMYQWFDDITNFAAQSRVGDLAYASAILNKEYDYVTGYAIERKNKYKYYSMPGADDYNILGEHYMMADGSSGQLTRDAHNERYNTVDQEVRSAITQWREYLGDNFEWDRGSRPLDTSVTVNPDGSFNYQGSTLDDFTGFDNYDIPNFKKGGSIESLPKFVRGVKKSKIATLKEGGTPNSAWGGSLGKIYDSPKSATIAEEVQGLLSPRSMATY